MTSRKLTGLLLIIGPAMIVLGMIVTLIGVGVLDWSDSQATISSLANNLAIAKVAMFIMPLGLVLGGAGLSGLNASMAGGSGAQYARVGLFSYVVGIAVAVGESAMTIGAAQAASNGETLIAEALYAAAPSMGSLGISFAMLGFVGIGVGILIQKNFNRIISGFMVALGLFGMIMPIINYHSYFMMIPYIGFVLLMVALGILFIRAKQ